MSVKPLIRPLLGALLVAAYSLLLLACAGGSPKPGVGSDEALSAGVTGGRSGQAAEMAPDFALEDLEGVPVRLSDSAGKIRLLDFWATWCAPCREEIPMLNELHDTYADRGLQILAISEEDSGVIRNFVDEYGVTYPNLVGTTEVSEQYGVLGLPMAYLVDGEGRIIESFIGPKPRKVLVEKIKALLDSSAGLFMNHPG